MKLPKGKSLIVLIPACTVLFGLVILLEFLLLRHTGGHVSYPLDSSFLSISTAKNLAFYKVWGVSKYYFQSATSSLLYPLLLAVVFFITGAHLIVPVIVNTLLALGFLHALQQALLRRRIESRQQAILLLTVTLLTLLPLLAVSGTENVLQLLICFLFMETFAAALENPTGKLPPRVYLYAIGAVATRYEDLLLVVLACILLRSMNRKQQALKLAALALLPILVFGVISLLKGSYFLPTPMIMTDYPIYLVVLFVAAFGAGLAFIRRYHRPAIGRYFNSIHRLSFAWLIAMAIPFVLNNGISLSSFEQDSIRIYEQQYPVAAFVHRYYRMGTIGSDDMAALAYFSDGRKVDFSGAISPDIARSKRESSWNPVMADSVSRKNGVMTAILSDSLFEEGLPSRWYKIASWDLPDTRPGERKTFTFYSIFRWDSVLQRRLHDYEPLLPPDISVRYY